jgi:hypothetical protein
MDLKVVHISRNQHDRKEADARALWENVLKAKWEKRSRARAEGLLTKLPGYGENILSGIHHPDRSTKIGRKNRNSDRSQ